MDDTSGFAGLVGLVLLYQGLADGPNRLVSPLSAVIAAAVPVAVGVSLGDRPDALAIMGLCVAPVAIWLVAGGDLKMIGSSKRPLLLGVGAGLGFGTFFALLAQTPDDAGAVPLLAARVTSVAILILAAMVTRPGKPVPSVLVSLFPATTVLLAVLGTEFAADHAAVRCRARWQGAQRGSSSVVTVCRVISYGGLWSSSMRPVLAHSTHS
mgnify:CR=1 FL=1